MSILDRFRLDGKTALVTGGSRGLGREMALALADAGADVAIVARDEESLQQTATEIRALGPAAIAVAADASEPAAWQQSCRRLLADQGTFDILVNNIGGRLIDTPTEDLPLEQWQRIVDLNLTSTFLATQIFGKAMIDRGRGGRIINVASISGMIASRGIGGRGYETSKAAVIHFTRTVAADWAPHAITANAICPGGFMTEPNQRWSRERPDVIETFNQQIPLHRFGDPVELGPLAVYLASQAAGYVTGAAFVIDGGYTVW